ncbi:MAG TPA: hypothetical protein PLM53_13550 [Spirochaetota bacterium]|nr:hypothetical protein [Spirochaetota bacterium]HQH98120.1 hypothetical protein [Spirochaetota bacterium]
MKIKRHYNIILLVCIIGIISSIGFTRPNEKLLNIQTILTQYDKWVQLEPETFTWNYVFGSNKYAFFPHSIEYYKNINPEMKDEIKSMIIIGNYSIKDNIIYLDNGSEEKETLIFKGKGNVKFSDASGHRYSKNGYYFHSDSSESNKYMASKISTVEKNDAVIEELEKLR